MVPKLLVAESQSAVKKIIDLIFLDKNYEVNFVDTRLELLQELQNNTYDLLILNFQIDENYDGYDLASEIKNAYSGLLILMLFGEQIIVDENKFKKSGVSAKALKPLNTSRFIKLVEELLSSCRAQEVFSEDFLEIEAMLPRDEKNESWIEWSQEVPEKIKTNANCYELSTTNLPPVVKNSENSLEQKSEKTSSESVQAIDSSHLESSVIDATQEVQLEKIQNDAQEWQVEEQVIGKNIVENIFEKIDYDHLIKEITPRIKEEIEHKILKHVELSLEEVLEKNISEIVPTLAEAIINKEIEAIREKVFSENN